MADCARRCGRKADVRLTVGTGDKVRVRDYCEPCMAEWRATFAGTSPPVVYREQVLGGD